MTTGAFFHPAIGATLIGAFRKRAIYAKRAKTGAEPPFSRANPIYALTINSIRAAGGAGAWP